MQASMCAEHPLSTAEQAGMKLLELPPPPAPLPLSHPVASPPHLCREAAAAGQAGVVVWVEQRQDLDKRQGGGQGAVAAKTNLQGAPRRDFFKPFFRAQHSLKGGVWACVSLPASGRPLRCWAGRGWWEYDAGGLLTFTEEPAPLQDRLVSDGPQVKLPPPTTLKLSVGTAEKSHHVSMRLGGAGSGRPGSSVHVQPRQPSMQSTRSDTQALLSRELPVEDVERVGVADDKAGLIACVVRRATRVAVAPPLGREEADGHIGAF